MARIPGSRGAASRNPSLRSKSAPRYSEEGRPQKPSAAHPVGYSPKGYYDKPDPGLGMKDTAMPGFGRNPRNKWGEKTYDRYSSYANPGQKAGGSAEPLRTFRDATQRRGRGYGMLDNGGGRGFGVTNFGAGNEGRGGKGPGRKYEGSKRMNQTTGTPTSILNTGNSRIGAMNMDNPSSKVRDADSVLDSGDGTGWGGKGL